MSVVRLRVPLSVFVVLLGVWGRACLGQIATNDHLPHFHQVNATFFRGAQPTEMGFAMLAKQGVKTVINLRSADEKSVLEEQQVKNAGLRYFNIPLKGRGRPTDADVEKILSVINTPGNQPIFLHCKRGKDRTGTIVACYRISHDAWTGDQALAEAKRLRLGWSELGMKRYIRDFSRKQSQRSSHEVSEVPLDQSKPPLTKEP